MSLRLNASILILILSLCSLSGCIQSYGTVVEPQVVEGTDSNPLVSGWDQCGITFYNDFKTAQEAALKENKPMMLFFYAPNCIFSRQMLKETLHDQDVVKLSQQFICVRIDESRERKMCEEYDVKGTPTVQFMNPQGILLQRLTAKKSANQLILQMQVAIESLAARNQKLVK